MQDATGKIKLPKKVLVYFYTMFGIVIIQFAMMMWWLSPNSTSITPYITYKNVSEETREAIGTLVWNRTNQQLLLGIKEIKFINYDEWDEEKETLGVYNPLKKQVKVRVKNVEEYLSVDLWVVDHDDVLCHEILHHHGRLDWDSSSHIMINQLSTKGVCYE